MRPDLPPLLVIRHGETEWNRIGRWQGPLDSPLTEVGLAQARAVGALLRDLGVTGASHRAFTSPQGRARRTAELALGGPARPDSRLREIGIGDWAGLTPTEIIAAAHLPAEAELLDYYAAAPGAEPFEALFLRVQAFLVDLTGPSVIFTHGITSRFLRAAALGLPHEQAAALPGGQGVIHRVVDGRHETLDAGAGAE